MKRQGLKRHLSSASHGKDSSKRFSGRREAKKGLGMRVVGGVVWT